MNALAAVLRMIETPAIRQPRQAASQRIASLHDTPHRMGFYAQRSGGGKVEATISEIIDLGMPPNADEEPKILVYVSSALSSRMSL